MILYGLLFGLWPCAYLLLQEYTFFSEKQIRNYISMGHSITCSIFSGCSLLLTPPSILQTVVVYLSASYFIWDTFYIMFKQQWKESLYLYHHIICLFLVAYLYFNLNIYILTYALCIGEISNIWNYIVYDMIQRKISQRFILPTKIVQVCWFCYFRVYLNSYILYNHFHELVGYLLPYNLLVIYAMGLIWGCKQIQSTMLEIYHSLRNNHQSISKTE